MANQTGKYSRRTIALFWLVAVAIMISAFIYYEQIALLYVIATLGLSALMIIVAVADLESVGRENLEG
jgi:hypothetical protein